MRGYFEVHDEHNLLFSFRECINRVCEAAGLKSADKKRRVDFIENYFLFIDIIIFYNYIYVYN